jgi:hypothetical protein
VIVERPAIHLGRRLASRGRTGAERSTITSVPEAAV